MQTFGHDKHRQQRRQQLIKKNEHIFAVLASKQLRKIIKILKKNESKHSIRSNLNVKDNFNADVLL